MHALLPLLLLLPQPPDDDVRSASSLFAVGRGGKARP
jgi:hypothetical protein